MANPLTGVTLTFEPGVSILAALREAVLTAEFTRAPVSFTFNNRPYTVTRDSDLDALYAEVQNG